MKRISLKLNLIKNNRKYFTQASPATKTDPNQQSFDFLKNYFQSDLEFKNRAVDKFKCFRVMDQTGEILNSKYENIPKPLALKIFKTMIQIRECDERFLKAQREGNISFYMTCTGEEASTSASSAALSDEDYIYPQYREAACLLFRGFTIQQMANQLTANEHDNGKGRQMPVHYGSKNLNFQTVSSPLCTQVPQASGAGYHFRVKNMNKIALTYFGEGAASEGDFHPALNFASVLRSQTLFFCRNNMYAISTPIDEQYNGDGIAIRGISYGINTVRIDGNDVFAVYNAVKSARELILETKRPVLIECMSYRGGDHSTSDYSKMYRDNEEMKKWLDYLQLIGDPIKRFYDYLLKKGWTTQSEYNDIVEEAKSEVRQCLKNAMHAKKPSINSLFEDVYEQLPEHLVKQRSDLKLHLEKYGDNYNLDQYKV